MKYKVGDVVIVDTKQAGTIHSICDGEICVLLGCADLWYGPESGMRRPRNAEDLKNCVKEIDKFAARKAKRQ